MREDVIPTPRAVSQQQTGNIVTQKVFIQMPELERIGVSLDKNLL
jgi:hypothetical protein